MCPLTLGTVPLSDVIGMVFLAFALAFVALSAASSAAFPVTLVVTGGCGEFASAGKREQSIDCALLLLLRCLFLLSCFLLVFLLLLLLRLFVV